MADREPREIRILWLGRTGRTTPALPRRFRLIRLDPDSGIGREMEEYSPDLVVLDLTEKARQTLKVLVEINQLLPSVPVIGLVDCDSEVLKKAIEAGLQDFIFAPFEASELESRLKLAARRLEVVRTYGYASGSIRECSTELELPTDFKLVSPVADILTRDLKSGHKATQEIVFQLRMTLSELLTNAMEHGSLGITLDEKLESLEKGGFDRLVARRLEDPERSGRRVRVRADRTLEEISYIIEDQGSGFDVEETMARLSEPDPGMPCGRGLYLLSQFVDEFRFEKGGRRVILKKRLDPQHQARAGEEPDQTD